MVAVWVPTWLPLQVLELLPPVQHLAEIVLHDAHHTCDLVLNPAAKERGEKGDNEGRGEGTMYKYMKNARGWTQELVIHANDGAWPPDPNGYMYVHLPLHLGIYSVHPSMSGPASASQQLTVWFCDHGPLLLNGVECLGCCLQIWNQGGDISITPSLQVAMQ